MRKMLAGEEYTTFGSEKLKTKKKQEEKGLY